ncbi:BRO-N domain-containing protein [Acutalibacter sp. 1XD8-36]|uniref:BRO-N domain-containing protein n=1 Tax=Acutalibacter sp. 1XD8-36 TaxID=2320852 RepID=UPI001372A307
MNDLQIFNNSEFGEIRTIQRDGEPWFVGKDVAIALGYEKPRNAIAAHVDGEDKKVALIQGPLGGPQEMTIINESGLYCLIFSSKLEKAKEFKRWVTREVLPTIRKTGSYAMNQYPPAVSPNGLSRLIGKYEKIMERMNCTPAEIANMAQHFCMVWNVPVPKVVDRHLPEQLSFYDLPALQSGE